jgi:glycerophosphoryl diester phosphodiesterase
MRLTDLPRLLPNRRAWLARHRDQSIRPTPAPLFPGCSFLRIAHRGAAGLDPENTLRGLETALRYGVEMVEIDVRPCADGSLVVFHDDDLERMTGRPGKISRSSPTELRALRVGKDERIPTLDEALDLLRGRALVNLDQKGDHLAPRLLAAIDRAGSRDEVLLSGGARATFRAFRHLAPNVPLVWSLGASWENLHKHLLARYTLAGARGQAGYIILATRAGLAKGATVDWRLAAPAVVQRVHRAGYPLLTWTVDDLPTLRALRQAGVDGVTSNRPDVLAQLT